MAYSSSQPRRFLSGWSAKAAKPAKPADAGMKRVQFSSSYVPYLFLAPQLAVIFIFFYWPSVQAIHSSFYIEDPFGFGASFVGFANYSDAIFSPEYLSIAKFTVVFTVLVTFFSLALGLLLAVKADAVIRGSSTYKTLLISVYAIAPPVAGLIGMMFFDQHIGPFVKMAAFLGWDMKVGLNYFDTAFAMIVVAVWKQIPYNFIFFLSGLQGVPVSVREAAAIDCRSGFRRFWTVIMPLLAPTAFFLLIINITYALFDTFGVIDVMVKDKAANNPITLVYKVFLDGFRGNDIGGSSAQSVILMLVVFVLTIIQFRFIEKRIHYN
ncbi:MULTISPECIES: ABC transporter permease subunit [Agrobacterium]|uniref:sn-glycerol-3-phosphate transport system permease protein UgpA n=2 Tax=Agrobacterium salinitolerans TaxID=1183413 RepID=A0A9X3KQ41_9HYPH|nr:MULTISPECIES: ABC transporter permease subunit [Agrobacterium]MBA4777008.1 ABC transporter permease subunit [Hyphomicrobiales bacterium]MCZ7850833.1 ABC transporter permease subunit [Agrobacterium salinitolerans]MCZ7856524.1 ABC transporter permease subunit [Agrobacterium salinitolerans]MCZ7863424.1 ABC transporter permease subunit [Agrobacterium salinitolerans]MCZ7889165.1 ABC transporter permease subunit [Agrobacterium salinitolerans]